MSFWNYRVVKRGDVYAIHECYYDEHGVPNGLSKDEMTPAGISFDDLKINYDLMGDAFDKPAIDYDNPKNTEGEKIVKY